MTENPDSGIVIINEPISTQRVLEMAAEGINIYPEKARSEWVEFDSMINIRPRLGNRSRGVEDAGRRQLICEIVDSLIR